MKPALIRFWRNERGASLAILAVTAAGMLAMLALGIDLGMLFTARGEAERAAEAAALAGAAVFQLDTAQTPSLATIEEAKDSAKAYLARNYVRNETLDTSLVASAVLVDSMVHGFVEVIPDQLRVRVQVRRPGLSLWFARLVGQGLASVTGYAAAHAAPAGAIGPNNCLKPFAIPDLWAEIDDDHNRNGLWDFDLGLGCNGNNCPPQENWQFNADAGDTYDRDVHGYGTAGRNDLVDRHGYAYNFDDGRRVPLKINIGNDASVPSHWFPWTIPNNGRGTNSLRQAIQGCVNLNLQIGATLAAEGVEPEPGNAPQPTYDAIMDLLYGRADTRNSGAVGQDSRPADPNARWSDEHGTVINSDLGPGDAWKGSNRLITVAIFNPEDMRSGRHNFRFVDFAQFFLENPEHVYGHINPAHKRPITARLVRFGAGTAGDGDGESNNLRTLRLIPWNAEPGYGGGVH